MEQKLNLIRVDLIIIIMILIAGLKFSFKLENRLDIALYDESNYLYQGVTLLRNGFPHAENGPFYALWYFTISLFEPNSVALYYLNYKLTMILLPILTYGLLRRNMVSIPVSLITSWLLLISSINVGSNPRISHFALFLILITFLFIEQKRSLLWNSLIASTGALLVSYVRPEYFLTYILSVLLFVFLFIKDYKKLEKKHLFGLIAYGLFSAVLLGALGLPVTGNRSIFAFGQHFSLNWVSWNSIGINPWTNWKEIMSLNFGSVHSIPEAFFKNPSAFLMHVTYNLLALKSTPQLFLPDFVSLDKTFVFIIYSLLVVILIFRSRKKIKEYGEFLILVILFHLPIFISTIIIFPRQHYLLLFSMLIVMIPLILSTTPDFKQNRINFRELLLFCVLLILITPHFGRDAHVVNKPNLITIEFIKSLKIEQHVNILEAQGGYHIYLGSNFSRIAEYSKDTTFNNFIKKRNINMIVVSPELLNDTRFKDDSEWQSFLINYSQFGYVQLVIPNTDRRIIVRDDLL